MKKERDFFKALYEALEKIGGSLDHDEVMKNVVESTVKALQVKACSIRIVDRRRRKLILGSSTGLSEGYIRKGPVLIEASALDREALEGKTIYVENAQSDSRWQYPQKAQQEGIFSVLVAPLTAEGKTVGEVLKHLSDKYPSTKNMFIDDEGRMQNHFEVYLNGKSTYHSGTETPVNDGDKIDLVYIIHGG